MNVWRSGTRVWSRASSRTCSRLGAISMFEVSATTAIERLECVAERQPARGEQHGRVVEHVGSLVGDAVVALARRGARHLLGLLPDLRAYLGRVREKLGGVAALERGGAPPLHRPLQRRKRFVGRHDLAVAV